MIVGPRVEFDPDHYPRIRVWDPRAQKDRYLYLHRLSAFASGKIDDLWAPEEVHHLDHDRWNSRPENLEACDPVDHADHHLNGGAAP